MFFSPSPRNVSGKSRSILLLVLAAGILSSGTLFYHYQRGNITFSRDPFRYGSSSPSFVPTAPWPPPTLHAPTTIPLDADGHRYPPLYPDITAAEYLLPQHNDALPFPEGSSARFVRFANEQPGVGFNNQLKEMYASSSFADASKPPHAHYSTHDHTELSTNKCSHAQSHRGSLLNSEIARLGGRTYVFADVVWDPNTNESYVKMPDEPERNHLAHGAKYRAAKLPLRAFIDAPSSGSAWPKGVRAPRAVSAAWYERMCPPERRHLVNTREINSEMGLNLGSAEGLDIVTKWGKYLRSLSDKPCVELVRGSDRLIDWECVILLTLYCHSN